VHACFTTKLLVMFSEARPARDGSLTAETSGESHQLPKKRRLPVPLPLEEMATVGTIAWLTAQLRSDPELFCTPLATLKWAFPDYSTSRKILVPKPVEVRIIMRTTLDTYGHVFSTCLFIKLYTPRFVHAVLAPKKTII
jgi:hypothetical protein